MVYVSLNPVHRALIIALLFQVAWLLVGVLFALSGLYVHWPLLIANIFSLWAPALLIRLTNITLPEVFQVGFAIFITASSFTGSALGGYNTIPHWDTLVHGYSGLLLAWFGFIIVSEAQRAVKRPFPEWFRGYVALMTPMGLAAVWEIYEFTSDRLWGTSMQAGGLEDTVVDMLAALIGATLAIIINMVWFAKNRKRPRTGKLL